MKYVLSGDQAGNYTVADGILTADIYSVLKVEAIEKSTLNDARKQAVETLGAKSKIVNILRCTKDGTAHGKARMDIVIGTGFFTGYEASALHVWYLAEDGTLTEVQFKVNAKGEIVISGGNLGVYVITA